MSGKRLLPPSEYQSAIGQLCETSFYMGASFIGGQVADTLALDDAYVDEVTRETFHVLVSMAIAAMQTSGQVMIAQGGGRDVES